MIMPGDRRIILTAPGGLSHNSLGEEVRSSGRNFVRWAKRHDRGGAETVFTDVRAGAWESRFEIASVGLADLDHTWSLTDDRERVYDIEAVLELPPELDPARTSLWIYAVRRS